jgi:hypothetical protein
VYRALRLCSNSGGYEAIPEFRRVLDLGQVRARLEAAGIPVLDARVMLIATLPPEVTISRSGRLLFKTTDERGARNALDRLLSLADLAGPARPAAPAPLG